MSRCPRCGVEVVDRFDALFHALRKDGRSLCQDRPVPKAFRGESDPAVALGLALVAMLFLPAVVTIVLLWPFR